MWQRGGNASNSATVLTHLGRKCELLTTFSDDRMFAFVIDDLKDRGIDIKNAFYYQSRNIPFSTVLLSKKTGMRTIIHFNKDLPHVNFNNFDKCDLDEYCWVHFEARNPDETTKMMLKIRAYNETKPNNDGKIKISLELEKKRDENLVLIKYADVAFLGRDFAEILGCQDKKTAVYRLKEMTMTDERYRNENVIIICPWGKDGACALSSSGYCESQSYPPEIIVDTLGAGDTFCAACLNSLMNDTTKLFRAIHQGCTLAGFKCGHFGYDCIKEFNKNLLEF